MKRATVYTQPGCVEVIITKETAKSLTPLEFPRGSIIHDIRVNVEEACDAGAKLSIKGDGAAYGEDIALDAVKQEERVGRGVLNDYHDMTFDITGDITKGGVRVLVFFFHPTKVDKGL